MQKEPAEHGVQLVCPEEDWYVPAAQMVHVVALVRLEKEPALHTAGSTLPAAHALPAGQCRQTEADVPPSSGEYRPGGHWVGALAPFAQKEPAVHLSHRSCPSSRWNLPASHLVGVGSGSGLPWAVGAVGAVVGRQQAGGGRQRTCRIRPTRPGWAREQRVLPGTASAPPRLPGTRGPNCCTPCTGPVP